MPRQNRFKALFTDLDGTAVPNHPEALPSRKVVEAITKAQEKVIVSVATGRPFSMCRRILEKLNIKDYCIVEGGSQIVDPVTGKVVWEQALHDETIIKIIKVCSPFTFQEESDNVEPRSPEKPTLAGTRRMMVLLSFDEDDVNQLVDKLKKIPKITVLKVPSWRKDKWDVHISHIGASKRHALEVLLGMLELKRHEIIGIGDGQNDLPLFEASGFKVAMGNAIEELRSEADLIVPTVGNDGLAIAIEKLILDDQLSIKIHDERDRRD